MAKNFLAKISVLTIAFAALVSCGSSEQVVMFQGSSNGTSSELASISTIAIRPADKLSIVVNSKDPELASIFNLPIVSHQAAGTTLGGFTSYQNQISTYTVSSAGTIDFPILGTIKIAGLTREQISEYVKNEIITRNYIKDPVVTVEFANLYVSVLGDVKNPGRVSLDKDRMTVLDVIAKTGDINVTGLRNVKVFREEEGRQKCYEVDFTDADAVFKSPVYYVRQDDVIYVEPNRMKVRQSTVNGNNLLSTSFWISVGSLLTTIATFVVTLVMK